MSLDDIIMSKGKFTNHLERFFFLDRDQLVRYKFRWTDAEQMPMDNKLNKEEFLAFRHPEQSKLSMVKMVEMIINSLGIFRRLKSIFRIITYEPAIKQIACHYLPYFTDDRSIFFSLNTLVSTYRPHRPIQG